MRRLLLFVAGVYLLVIGVLLVTGPFMFDLGPLRVQASTFRKPVQVVVVSLVLALVLSPGVRALARQSRVLGFYVFAAVVTWVLTLGPVMSFMGNEGFRGPYHWLMFLPGVDSLRVPARFWLVTTICLAVIAGLVIAEFGPPAGDAIASWCSVSLSWATAGRSDLDHRRACPHTPGRDVRGPPDRPVSRRQAVWGRRRCGCVADGEWYSGWTLRYFLIGERPGNDAM
jgi:hypothetical protein